MSENNVERTLASLIASKIRKIEQDNENAINPKTRTEMANEIVNITKRALLAQEKSNDSREDNN